MLLAGDIGGTKTLLGLFERASRRPNLIASQSYATLSFGGFDEVLEQFARDIDQPFTIEAAAIGIAGPVLARHSAKLTNIPWNITSEEITARFHVAQAELLNDLEALAYGIDVLTTAELAILQVGASGAEGSAAVIAAGTGLGQAMLHRTDGHYVPAPSEGGHADFAARSEREMEFVRMLRKLYGRAEVEHVLSGPGLFNLYRFTHDDQACVAIRDLAPEDYPAAISQAALNGECARCSDALTMFVSAYGAEAGNLALRDLAIGGIFLGGGIAPKILPALEAGDFMRAFLDKGHMKDLLERIPVKVILTPQAGLLGAAVYAQRKLV
jgi:glucokinase